MLRASSLVIFLWSWVTVDTIVSSLTYLMKALKSIRMTMLHNARWGTFQFLVLTRTYVSGVFMNLERSWYEGDHYGLGFDLSIVSSNVEICRYTKMTTRMYQPPKLGYPGREPPYCWDWLFGGSPVFLVCYIFCVCCGPTLTLPGSAILITMSTYGWVRDLVAGAPRAVLKITIPISRKITRRFQGFHGN